MSTALNTIEDVTAAIRAIVDGPVPRALKPAQQRQRAARLADLYEIRARFWHEHGIAARMSDMIPDVYGDACVLAEARDWDSVRFWRGLA